MTNIKTNAPLADRMRPQSLDDFLGQENMVGEKSFLRQAITQDTIPSMILWGPPGCGKTTLATIIANETKADFIQISAVNSGVKDLRTIVERARMNYRLAQKTIIFIDEIHRWNKAQQDALLPHVEQGTVTLIGATTENPSFEINSALLSRSRVFVLNKLSAQTIATLLAYTLKNETKGLGNYDIKIDKDTIGLIATLANGDARSALNILDICAQHDKKITQTTVKKIVQKAHLYYDKNGEEHYNIISALHKAMRGGDPHASVYWLTRMLEGGEDPKYVARRLIRFAAEDIGLADNNALILSNATFEACHKIGMPECNVILTQCVIYLAQAPKSITAYQAYKKALQDVNDFGNLPVPLHIRNAPTKLMKDLNYGKNYKYTPLENSSQQEYFPTKLKGKKYF